jgi:hypothetical protein
MSGTFISYRREDAAGYAGRLRESLERRLGASRVFRDVDTLRPGQDFVQAIESRLSDCAVMLAVIAANGPARDLQAAAGSTAPTLRPRKLVPRWRPTVLVVPVLVEGATMPAPADLPENIRTLTRRHAVSVRDETWDADVERLVNVIESAISMRDPSRADAPISAARLWVAAALAVVIIGLLVFNGNRARSGGNAAPPAGTGVSSRGGAGSLNALEPPATGNTAATPRSPP